MAVLPSEISGRIYSDSLTSDECVSSRCASEAGASTFHGMTSDQIQIIGVGSLCEALVNGWLESGFLKPSQLVLVHRSAERAQQLAQRWPGIEISSKLRDIENSILTVRPGDIEGVCKALGVTADRSRGQLRVISTAGGILVARIELWLGKGARVLRVMPNLGVSVGAGQTAVAGGSQCDERDVTWALALFASCGDVVRLDERLFPAFTAVFGSGPGFLFLLAQAMIDAAVAQGISADDADRLVRRLIRGTGTVLCESNVSVADLLSEVVVPNGTTLAGIAVLEERGVDEAIAAAIEAATQRSHEISHG